jgi:hypothetical protein
MREMKIAIAIITVAATLIIFGPDAAFSQSNEIDNLENTYGTYIDKYISTTEAKVEMLRNSKSENLRKQFIKYCLKLEFLKTHKKDLANNMIASNVGRKPYQIQSFLNGSFFNEVRITRRMADLYDCGECGRKISLKTLKS